MKKASHRARKGWVKRRVFDVVIVTLITGPPLAGAEPGDLDRFLRLSTGDEPPQPCQGYMELAVAPLGSSQDTATLFGNAHGWCMFWKLRDHRSPNAAVVTYDVATVLTAESSSAADAANSAECAKSSTCTKIGRGQQGTLTGPWPEGLAHRVYWWVHIGKNEVYTSRTVTLTTEVHHKDCDLNTPPLPGAEFWLEILLYLGESAVQNFCERKAVTTEFYRDDSLSEFARHSIFFSGTLSVQVSASVNVLFDGGDFQGLDTWEIVEHPPFSTNRQPYDTGSHSVSFTADRAEDQTTATYDADLSYIWGAPSATTATNIQSPVKTDHAVEFIVRDGTNGAHAEWRGSITVDWEAPDPVLSPQSSEGSIPVQLEDGGEVRLQVASAVPDSRTGLYAQIVDAPENFTHHPGWQEVNPEEANADFMDAVARAVAYAPHVEKLVKGLRVAADGEDFQYTYQSPFRMYVAAPAYVAGQDSVDQHVVVADILFRPLPNPS